MKLISGKLSSIFHHGGLKKRPRDDRPAARHTTRTEELPTPILLSEMPERTISSCLSSEQSQEQRMKTLRTPQI
jgi:hypothetical protein